MPEPARLQALFLIKPGAISRPDIERAEKQCGICIIECASPDETRFLEPPTDAGLGRQARAALSLMRLVTRNPSSNPLFSRDQIHTFFLNALLDDPPPTPVTRVAPPAKKRKPSEKPPVAAPKVQNG